MGDAARARDHLEAYRDKHPGNTTILLRLAGIYVQEGHADEARKVLTTVLTLEPGKNEAKALLTEIQARMPEPLNQKKTA